MDFVTDLVTLPLDFVTDLVTLPLDFVTSPPPKRNHKLLRLVVICKCNIDIFIKRTSNATANARVWQQIYGIIEKEHIARH